MIDKDLVKDIKEVFKTMVAEHFPVKSVIPVSDKRFRKNGRWDDDLSMAADNSSAFNYRPVTGGTRLSNHAYGRAVDINTFENPYVKGVIILPPGAKYDPAARALLPAIAPSSSCSSGLGGPGEADGQARSTISTLKRLNKNSFATNYTNGTNKGRWSVVSWR